MRDTLKSIRTSPVKHVGVCVAEIEQFLHGIKTGDAVLYPIKSSDTVMIGQVVGPASHDSEGTYTTTRRVLWIRSYSRRDLPGTPGESVLSRPLTLYELPEASQEFWWSFDTSQQYRLLADDYAALLDQEGEAAERLKKEVDADHARVEAARPVPRRGPRRP